MNTIDKKEVKIRRMVSSDITPTLEIWWADIPEKEMVTSQLRGPLDLSFIAEYEGHFVGFILARLICAGLPMVRVGVIFYIAVNPDYQNCGIGSMLVNALKSNCKAEGIETIRALVPHSETRMMKYFEKMGFHASTIINLDSPV